MNKYKKLFNTTHDISYHIFNFIKQTLKVIQNEV